MYQHFLKHNIQKMEYKDWSNQLQTKKIVSHLNNYSLFFVLLILFSSCQPSSQKKTEAQKSILDLQNYDFEKEGIVELRGEWNFYWKKLYTYQDLKNADSLESLLFRVPRNWNGLKVKGEEISSYGYATYHLKIKLPQNKLKLAMKVPTFNSAYNLYIDGELVAKNGKVGTTKATSTPEYLPLVVDFENSQKEVNITLQVCNFWQKAGGPWANIQLGLEPQIRKIRENANRVELFLLGSILIMGLYHIGLFWARRRSISALYFAFFCFAMVIRVATTGERLLQETGLMSWAWTISFEYLTINLCSLSFLYFLYTLFPKELPKWLLVFITWLLGIVSLIYIVLPPQIFTHFLIVTQMTMIFSGFYFIFGLIRATYRKKEGALELTFGFTMLFAAFCHDILFYEQIIDMKYWTTNWTPFGLLAFIFAQALILAFRFSSAFKKSEILTEELDSVNKNLEGLVEKRTLSLQESNMLLKKKTKDMMDSLNYASRIQQSILPSMQEIKSVFPDCFVFYQPRDVVSGDFYWFTKFDNPSGELEKIVMTAVDCTGHGVPGAFMSMIGNDLLNAIVKEKHIHEPDKILNQLHKGVRQALQQQESNNKDGMDMSLVSIDLENKKLAFAGAKNPLIYIQNNELKVIKGDKIPIGGDQQEIERIFTLHEIDISQPTTFYLFSDGYQDQFGGKKNKKFMLKNMKKLLLEIVEMPMENQKAILTENIDNWMKEGNEHQIDDMLIVGLRV